MHYANGAPLSESAMFWVHIFDLQARTWDEQWGAEGIPAATREFAKDVSIARVGLMGQWVAHLLPTHIFPRIHTQTHYVKVHVELE